MHKFKLNEFQLQRINSRLEYSSKDTEDYLLKVYGVFSIEDLPSTEYDEIINHIDEFNRSK